MEKGMKTSSSSKSCNTDTKTKQDITNKYLRQSKFKENVLSRPDLRQKPNPQKNREVLDKRPRNRTDAVCKKYRSEINDANATGSALPRQGCKKTNLNHLLNFTLAPAEHWEPAGRRVPYNKHKAPKYNKELFLQANCQFVVRENGNYNIYQKDPDILVEWSLIEEICLPCHEVPSCPICLYPPVAAKISRCGHIFCWTCALHYLALTDKTWQKCPICFEAIHKTDLKSVSECICKPYAIEDEITMCLMKRDKGSLLSIPKYSVDASQSLYYVDQVNSVTRYQKLLLAGKKEIQIIIDRERKQLNISYQEEKDSPEACFIESALQLLNEREKNLLDQPNNVNEKINEKNSNICQRKHSSSVSSVECHSEHHEHDQNIAKIDNVGELTLDEDVHVPLKCLPIEEKKEITYFYQSEDGQHIYLHNINVRMLVKEFGALELAPQFITSKIVEIGRVSMTEVLRKKLRYLKHLPLTCEFRIVELDFSNCLSQETMHEFEDEIKNRKQNRMRKARDERRREKIIEREENRKLGKYPKATYNIKSADQFPAYNPEDFLLSSPKNNFLPVGGNCDINMNSNDPTLPVREDILGSPESVPTTSFAQMLKDGPKSFSSAQKAQKAGKNSTTRQSGYGSDDDDDRPTSHSLSFSDAIQAALDAVTLQTPSDKSQNSRKKKKGKQLLFTTSMCRNK